MGKKGNKLNKLKNTLGKREISFVKGPLQAKEKKTAIVPWVRNCALQEKFVLKAKTEILIQFRLELLKISVLDNGCLIFSVKCSVVCIQLALCVGRNKICANNLNKNKSSGKTKFDCCKVQSFNSFSSFVLFAVAS